MALVTFLGTIGVLGLVLLLAGCSLAVAPVGSRMPTLCEYIRLSVREGSMPMDLALANYRECGPFEVRR